MLENKTIKLSKNVWFLFVSLYITQYIGIGFLTIALAIILRQNGMALDQLSLIPLMMMPIGIKVLWAPFIDKYLTTRLYHYRNWLQIAIVLMLLCLLVIAFLDPIKQYGFVLLLIFIFSIMTATQDLALSGLTCEMFSEDQRYFISSVKMSGAMVGNILGGGGVLLFYPYIGWMGCLLLIIITLLFTLSQLCFFKEYQYRRINYITEAVNKYYWKNLLLVWKGKISWLMLLMVIPFSLLPAYNLMSPLLVDNGWSLPDIAILLKVFGSIVSLVAVFFISKIIKRLTRRQSLISALVVHACCLLSFIPLSLGNINIFSVYFAFSLYFMSLPFLSIPISAIIMDNTEGTRATSTTYNAQTSVGFICGFPAISLSYFLAQHLGYFEVVLGSIIIAFLNAFYACKVIKPQKFSS